MVLSQFVFFNDSSTDVNSNIFANPQQANALTIQVDDNGAGYYDIGLEIYGGVDMTENSMYQLKVISLETFRPVITIDSAGIYLCIVSGVANVQMRCTNESVIGAFKAFTVSIS